MNIVAIIQAHMGSTRLPGKVMKDLAGQPMLVRVVERTYRARTLSNVVIATTELPADDVIIRLCGKQGWFCFRGSEDDVLDRYYQTAQYFHADAIVRISSDCPLIDPGVIDNIVSTYISFQPDIQYVSNNLTRTYPYGLDAEVIKFTALEKAWQEDHNPSWREHVTLYILRHPEIFKMRGITNDKDYSYMRWTVDTPEDLKFVRKIYNHFKHDKFSWREVLQLLEMHPGWLKINQNVRQKIIQ